MYAFHQRPLTGLFLIALACLNALGLATGHEASWYSDVLAAQFVMSAGWLVLGDAHRLMRAAVFVLVPMFVAAPDYFKTRNSFPFPSVFPWDTILGAVIFLSGMAALATCFWLAMIRIFTRVPPEGPKTRWQFPLVEVFGWMIVVAMASIALRYASFEHLPKMAYVATLIVPAALVMALFLRGDAIPWRLRATLGGAAVAFSLLMTWKYPDVGSVHEAAVCFGFLGAWILVQRLDAQMPSDVRAAGAPPASVKLFNPSSD